MVAQSREILDGVWGARHDRSGSACHPDPGGDVPWLLRRVLIEQERAAASLADIW